MTTAYTVSDSLPQDNLGNYFLAAVTSSLEFALLGGVALSPIGGRNTVHLAVATHSQGAQAGQPSAINLIGGAYLDDPGASPVSSGQAKGVGANNWGELHSRGASISASVLSAGSRNTVKTSSGIVFGIHICGAGVTAGDTVTLIDDTRTKFGFTFSGANETLPSPYIPGGVPFATTIIVDRSLSGGAASVTLMYR